ncbi:hypothetical protein [Streptomyces canus]|uniref:hypothetical protein n=1 Tax=Streptomyces canus TaxID=58343 RepID=UPI0037151453
MDELPTNLAFPLVRSWSGRRFAHRRPAYGAGLATAVATTTVFALRRRRTRAATR